MSCIDIFIANKKLGRTKIKLKSYTAKQRKGVTVLPAISLNLENSVLTEGNTLIPFAFRCDASGMECAKACLANINPFEAFFHLQQYSVRTARQNFFSTRRFIATTSQQVRHWASTVKLQNSAVLRQRSAKYLPQ